jgi:hypothetical protein
MEQYNKPKKFKTKREMLWYICGLKDAQNVAKTSLQIEIERYVGHLSFTDFPKKMKNKGKNE